EREVEGAAARLVGRRQELAVAEAHVVLPDRKLDAGEEGEVAGLAAQQPVLGGEDEVGQAVRIDGADVSLIVGADEVLPLEPAERRADLEVLEEGGVEGERGEEAAVERVEVAALLRAGDRLALAEVLELREVLAQRELEGARLQRLARDGRAAAAGGARTVVG